MASGGKHHTACTATEQANKKSRSSAAPRNRPCNYIDHRRGASPYSERIQIPITVQNNPTKGARLRNLCQPAKTRFICPAWSLPTSPGQLHIQITFSVSFSRKHSKSNKPAATKLAIAFLCLSPPQKSRLQFSSRNAAAEPTSIYKKFECARAARYRRNRSSAPNRPQKTSQPHNHNPEQHPIDFTEFTKFITVHSNPSLEQISSRPQTHHGRRDNRAKKPHTKTPLRLYVGSSAIQDLLTASCCQ